MTSKNVIAIDLGASNGRVMRVGFDGERLALEEVHRFPNIPVTVRGTLYWDALRIWHEIEEGVAKAGAASIGVDCWGVDIALLDRDGNLVSNPVHYRDMNKEGAMEWVFERVPRRTVFERTGIQFMLLNGLYQYASLKRDNSPQLDIAHTLLTIADLFNYWLTGSKTCEFTETTTTQMYDPRKNQWDTATLSALGLPTNILPEVVQPGTKIGTYHNIPVIASACHDTGSAVVAVPSTTRNSAYLSSGTWSLIGMEVDKALINDAVYDANYTNEGGIGGTYRLLKNIAGMWLVQQLQHEWAQGGRDYSYSQIVNMASEAAPFRTFVDPDDPNFVTPGDMTPRIREFCQRTNQSAPESDGAFARAVYESLALKYRGAVETLSSLTGRPIERLHIIGGGSQNTLLCQMTANAIGREVVAGPVEASALGNAIVQLMALGEIGDVAQARQIVTQSAEMKTYGPQDVAAWDAAYQRAREILDG